MEQQEAQFRALYEQFLAWQDSQQPLQRRTGHG